MDKSVPQIWRDVFANWPAQFRRKGVVIPSYGEPILFVDFVLNDNVVVLERPTPDTVGARRVTIPFQLIESLKYTEPLNTEQFLKAGFVKGGQAEEPRQATKVPVAPAPVQPHPVTHPTPTS